MHYAFVLDEYGTVKGMVTMDDILDALIGDVTEYNQQEYQIVQRDEHSWRADGAYSFPSFLHYFELEPSDGNRNYNTLAGFLLQHVPVAGEKTKWKDFRFEIIDMDGPRIDKVLITRAKS